MRNHQGINDTSQYQSWSVSWKIWMTRTSSRVSRLNWNEVLECWMLGYEHCTTGLYLRYQLLDTDIMNWILYDDINLCIKIWMETLWMKWIGRSVSLACTFYIMVLNPKGVNCSHRDVWIWVIWVTIKCYGQNCTSR